MEELGRSNTFLTISELEERIQQLKTDHEHTLRKIWEYYAHNVDRETDERYHQTELYKYFDDLASGDEWEEHYKRLDVRVPM